MGRLSWDVAFCRHLWSGQIERLAGACSEAADAMNLVLRAAPAALQALAVRDEGLWLCIQARAVCSNHLSISAGLAGFHSARAWRLSTLWISSAMVGLLASFRHSTCGLCVLMDRRLRPPLFHRDFPGRNHRRRRCGPGGLPNPS